MRAPVVLVCGQGNADAIADVLAQESGTVVVRHRFDGQGRGAERGHVGQRNRLAPGDRERLRGRHGAQRPACVATQASPAQ